MINIFYLLHISYRVAQEPLSNPHLDLKSDVSVGPYHVKVNKAAIISLFLGPS